MASNSESYVSADGHVVEPGDLWTTRIDKEFRDRAPRVESRSNGDYYLIDGFAPIPVGLEGVAIDDKIEGRSNRPKVTGMRIPGPARGTRRRV
jgi:hypothetical protein